MGTPPEEAGKSSFDLIERDALWRALPLAGTNLVLDLGCGSGRYTLALAERLPGARVVGFDLWREGVASLARQAAERGLQGCVGTVADLAALPGVAAGAADLALLGTVLHDLVPRGTADTVLAEAARVLRPGGELAVVEFHPGDTRPGPPAALRLSPDRVQALAQPHGFSPAGTVDLGSHCYLARLRRRRP